MSDTEGIEWHVSRAYILICWRLRSPTCQTKPPPKILSRTLPKLSNFAESIGPIRPPHSSTEKNILCHCLCLRSKINIRITRQIARDRDRELSGFLLVCLALERIANRSVMKRAFIVLSLSLALCVTTPDNSNTLLNRDTDTQSVLPFSLCFLPFCFTFAIARLSIVAFRGARSVLSQSLFESRCVKSCQVNTREFLSFRFCTLNFSEHFQL